MNFIFFLNSALLGIGLAMDAFSVSLANGLNEPKMKLKKVLTIAGIFAFFQAAMPMIGWFCVQTAKQFLSEFEKYIPFIALVLLAFIGGKMLVEGIRNKCESECTGVTFGTLIVQGIATSIDALSVGFTISEYGGVLEAVVCAGVIAVLTFGICTGGVFIGKKFGTKLSNCAQIFGGSILILIGIEIFVSSLF